MRVAHKTQVTITEVTISLTPREAEFLAALLVDELTWADYRSQVIDVIDDYSGEDLLISLHSGLRGQVQ